MSSGEFCAREWHLLRCREDGNAKAQGEPEHVLPSDLDAVDHIPTCPHGRMLLFRTSLEKEEARKRKKGSSTVRGQDDGSCRYYFSCSAYRDRRSCPHFCWLQDLQSYQDQSCVDVAGDDRETTSMNFEAMSRMKKASSRVLCRTCQIWTDKRHLPKHAHHDTLVGLTKNQLLRPIDLLTPASQNKGQAQFLFDPKHADYLIDTLRRRNLRRVVCIGCPTLHQSILALSSHQQLKTVAAPDHANEGTLSSFLLDMDGRFRWMFPKQTFARFNMFNQHFFESAEKQVAMRALAEADVVIIDPPFGAIPAAFALLVQTIDSWVRGQEHQCAVSEDAVHIQTPFIIYFPYFQERTIVERLAPIQMTDISVSYRNHAKFKDGHGKRPSAVRLFTNIKRLSPPDPSKFRFCERCDRFSALYNMHCDLCDTCPSKDGRTYRHCITCNKCVKPTWSHCSVCGRCQPRDHGCTNGDNQLLSEPSKKRAKLRKSGGKSRHNQQRRVRGKPSNA